MESRTTTPASFSNGSPAEAARPHFQPGEAQKAQDRYWLHLLLFLLTFATTAHAGGLLVGPIGEAVQGLGVQDLGMEWLDPSTWWFVPQGARFAAALLGFLTVHEFGHYFAARYHHINTSLPYYIPLPFLGIGTFGAVIRIREPIPTTRQLFDVGAAGPLAGFAMALAVLLYAFATLPPPEYLLTMPGGGHEALKAFIEQHGAFPDRMLDTPVAGEGFGIVVGYTPLYWGLAQLFPHVPPMYELIHYPVLLAGWFSLFFTALNLLPVGQLDGGHILYALVGRRWHTRLARGFVVVLLASGAIGFQETAVPALYAFSEALGRASWFILAGILYFFLNRIFEGNHRFTAPLLLGLVLLAAAARVLGAPLEQFGWSGWLFWSLLIIFLIKVQHPPVVRPDRLTPGRRALGVLSIIIFILCFSLRPLYFV